MLKVHYMCLDINIMGIFGCSLLMLKWMIIFVLLQVRLGNAGVSFVRHFIFSVKCLKKPNAGKQLNLFSALFSMVQPNNLNTFFLRENNFP